MNSKKSENDPDSSNSRVVKIRVAAATALKGLDELRSGEPVGQEALQEYDLVVQRRRDDLALLLIKIRRGEAGYDLVKKFLDENKGLPPETQV
jgi:hypothetical protein